VVLGWAKQRRFGKLTPPGKFGQCCVGALRLILAEECFVIDGILRVEKVASKCISGHSIEDIISNQNNQSR